MITWIFWSKFFDVSNAKLSDICQAQFCEVLFEVYFFIDSTSFKIKYKPMLS